MSIADLFLRINRGEIMYKTLLKTYHIQKEPQHEEGDLYKEVKTFAGMVTEVMLWHCANA